MKRVSEVFGIYPPHAEALEKSGVCTVADLVQVNDLAQLSARTGITEQYLDEWRTVAQQELVGISARGRRTRWFLWFVLAVVVVSVALAANIYRRHDQARKYDRQGTELAKAKRYDEAIIK